jgi:5-methylthioadenosine/S-adenosylhomocysteine deaminase
VRRLLIVLLLSAAIPSSAAAGDTYALRGTLVTPDEVIDNGVLLVQDGRIAGAGAAVTIPDGTRVIDTGGFIFPGLIDLHNHITWNAHPRWSPGTLVKNRYEWQAMDSYAVGLSGPHAKVGSAAECDLERFGEVKALTGGATTVAGSSWKDCNRGLARNVDQGNDFDKEPVQYRIFPFELKPDDEASVRKALADGKPVIVHLAEGVDASSARELRMARAHGYLRPGLVIVHGVALRENDFAELGRAGVGLVWSPRSNIELYGRTADVAAAKKHVVMAIAPDWSPSGSSGMIAELRYAALWSDQQFPPVFTAKELVQMATSNPARLAQIDDRVGRLAKGFYADYLVIRRRGARDPYESLIYAGPEDMLLVAVNGRPLFGDLTLLEQVNPSAKPESVPVCGAPKALDLSAEGQGVSFADTLKNLDAAFRLFQVPVAGLCP